MIASTLTVLLLALAATPASPAAKPKPKPAPQPTPKPTPKPGSDSPFTRMPLYFIENRGQVDDKVVYYVQAHGTTAFFTPEGIMFSFIRPPDRNRGQKPLEALAEPSEVSKPPEPGRWGVAMDLVGAREGLRPEQGELNETIVSYFKGPKEQWKTALPTYKDVVFRDIWPGIDLNYEGRKGQMKYTFIVQPGGDPSQIKLRYRGAPTVRVTAEGELEVKTPLGGILDQKPLVYQDVDGCREEVSAKHAVRKESANNYLATFKVGTYDRSRPLMIDPVVLFSFSGR